MGGRRDRRGEHNRDRQRKEEEDKRESSEEDVNLDELTEQIDFDEEDLIRKQREERQARIAQLVGKNLALGSTPTNTNRSFSDSDGEPSSSSESSDKNDHSDESDSSDSSQSSHSDSDSSSDLSNSHSEDEM